MPSQKKSTSRKTKKETVKNTTTKKTSGNNKKSNTKKKQNKKSKIVNSTIFIIVVCVVVLFTGFHVIGLIQEPTDIAMVQSGQISLDEAVEGYVIRTETVIDTQSDNGELNPIKNEGERVAKGEKIFNFYNSEQEETKDKIAELNKLINENLEKESKVFSSDIKTIEKQIENDLDGLYKMNNISEIEEYKKQLSSNINKKAKIAGELSPAGSYLKQLYTQRNDLEKQLNTQDKSVIAPISGMVSYRIDGLEAILQPTDFSKLTKDTLEDLDLKTSSIIPSSVETAKITDNFTAYITVVSRTSEAKNCKVGDTVTIRLNNTEEIAAKVEYILEEDTDRVITFRINNKLDELIKYRKIKLDIVWWSNTGLKVPNSAILYNNERTYVIRNRAGYLDTIEVKVKNKNEVYAIIENYDTEDLKEMGYTTTQIKNWKSISIYDEILNNPTIDKIN